MDLKVFSIFSAYILASFESHSINSTLETVLENIRNKCDVEYPPEVLQDLDNYFFKKLVENTQYELNQYMNNTDLQSKSSCVVNKLYEEIDKFSDRLSEDVKLCSTESSEKYIDLFLSGGTTTPYDPENCTEPANLETLHQTYANNMVSMSNLKDSIYYADSEEVIQKALVVLCAGAELSKYNGDLLKNGKFDQYIKELPFYVSRFSDMTQVCEL